MKNIIAVTGVTGGAGASTVALGIALNSAKDTLLVDSIGDLPALAGVNSPFPMEAGDKYNLRRRDGVELDLTLEDDGFTRWIDDQWPTYGTFVLDLGRTFDHIHRLYEINRWAHKFDAALLHVAVVPATYVGFWNCVRKVQPTMEAQAEAAKRWTDCDALRTEWVGREVNGPLARRELIDVLQVDPETVHWFKHNDNLQRLTDSGTIITRNIPWHEELGAIDYSNR